MPCFGLRCIYVVTIDTECWANEFLHNHSVNQGRLSSATSVWPQTLQAGCTYSAVAQPECGTRCVQIFILGILAGVYIGFGAFLMLSVGGSCPGLASSNPGLKALVSGLMGLPTGVTPRLLVDQSVATRDPRSSGLIVPVGKLQVHV